MEVNAEQAQRAGELESSLERFVVGQAMEYARALAEIRAGIKRTHCGSFFHS